MYVFWAVLGVLLIGIGLVDVFLTALNYDESGFIATRLCAFQWYCLRGTIRQLPQRWRQVVLCQVTGLNITLNITIWLSLIIVGYGLIYYGQMYGSNFQYDGSNMSAGLFSAMYFSAAQLATVGTSQINPETDMLRALSILETLTGVGLVTLILTFLLGVYQVVCSLRALSSNFVTATLDFDDPVASLGPYFSTGDLSCLDNHLRSIFESFWSYSDGLRQHHVAYYFQSGRPRFSLPYVVFMLGQWLAALRWGVPKGHPVSVQPLLAQLTFQFDQFAIYLQGQVRWTFSETPEVVCFEIFSVAYREGDATSDKWLGRFLQINQEMAQLAQLDLDDPLDAFQRYEQWLPFAHRAEQMMRAVSRDLDYRPPNPEVVGV